MSKPDGGPAFPVPYHPEQTWENSSGMTLRDYFAAAALERLMSMPMKEVTGIYWEEAARQCYLAADAMITEREKNE